MKTPSKFLITGGTGFIGSALTKALLKKGHQIRILDNQSRGSLRRLVDVTGQFEMIEGDIRDPQAVDSAVRGVDSVIHLAFINGTEFFYSMPELVLDVGVKGMVNILNSCIRHGVDDLVVASSSEVYQEPPITPTPENVRLIIPDPLNPRYSYAGGKIISELMTINYGRKFFRRAVIFRPHNVYGPDMGWEHVIPQFVLRMKDQIKTNNHQPLKFKIQGTGNETRAFCYIDDFTQGLLHVVNKGEHLEIYHIGTNQETPIKEVAQEVAKFYDQKIVIVPGENVSGSTPKRCPDISKLKKLGYLPKVPLTDGLRQTAQWYNDNAQLKNIGQIYL